MTGLIAMTLMRSLIPNSCHFQTHGLGIAMGVKVVGVPGLFYVYYGSGPLEASELIVCGLN